jgi:hypothetical protein
MEKTYGLGLTGLIHPVTKEFNHAAVIKQRGGRKAEEHLGNTKEWGMHHALGAVHGLFVKQEMPSLKEETAQQGADGQLINNLDIAKKWLELGGKEFDQYDWISFAYGWSRGLQEDPFSDESAVSECFIATFDTVSQLDYLW